jgi:cellulose biosynthesis protein BcsQ
VKTVATYSIKGGVGKTTSAVNIADQAARSGARVLLWDLDPQGATTFFLRVKPAVKGGAQRLIGKKGALADSVRATDIRGLHLVPADFSFRHLDLHLDDTKRPTKRLATLLDPLDDRYDVAILDCAPGMTLTSESVFAAVDALLVPTIPTTLSKRTLDQLADFLAESDDRPLVMPFASMVDRRKKLHKELVEEYLERVPGFLRTVIPNASVIERMGVEHAPLSQLAPRSAANQAFADLWGEVSARLWS